MMENLTSSYLTRAELWLFITMLVYFFMNGAQVFETAVLVPKWTASPPESLTMFRGTHGLDFKWFWIIMHSIHEITFILAIVFCWKLLEIRNWLLVLFLIHFAVRFWTLFYFAPQIIEFQRIANTGEVVANLHERAQMWQTMNYIRVGVFVVVSLAFIPLFIRMLQFYGVK